MKNHSRLGHFPASIHFIDNSFDPFSVPSMPNKPYNQFGVAKIVTSQNYPSIKGITVFYIEIFEESMRTIHVHANCDEIGYVLDGEIQVFIYSPKKVIFKVKKGGSWFIPRGAIHSLNNIGPKNAKLFVGFNSDTPSNYDLKKIVGLSEINPLFSRLGPSHIPNRGDYSSFSHAPIYWSPIPDFSIHKMRLDKKDTGRIFWFMDSSVFYVNLGNQCVIQIFGSATTMKKYNYYFVSIGLPHSFLIREPTDILLFYTSKTLNKMNLDLSLFPEDIIKNCLM